MSNNRKDHCAEHEERNVEDGSSCVGCEADKLGVSKVLVRELTVQYDESSKTVLSIPRLPIGKRNRWICQSGLGDVFYILNIPSLAQIPNSTLPRDPNARLQFDSTAQLHHWSRCSSAFSLCCGHASIREDVQQEVYDRASVTRSGYHYTNTVFDRALHGKLEEDIGGVVLLSRLSTAILGGEGGLVEEENGLVLMMAGRG